MVFGYVIIVLLMSAMNFYLIFRLYHLNRVTSLITRIDVPSIENGEKLRDSLLELVRNKKKYLITKDKAFLELFNEKKKEFQDRLKSIEESTARQEKGAFIHQIKKLYNTYLNAAFREFRFMDKGKVLNTRYEEKKKKILDQLTETIEELTFTLRTALIKKIELFQKIGYKSIKISLAITLSTAVFGAIFVYFFTRSICYPIKILKDATDNIAQGNLDYQIRVTSHDEIGNLGVAFNQMCDKLKEMDQVKTDFVANVSHNLKTPLTAIREANDLLLKKVAGPVSESQIRLLNIIKEETLQLTMMINDLLDISRVEAGLMRYNFQYLDMQDVIQKSIDEIRFLAENKNIHIEYTGGISLPRIILDRDKISQVMDNLLSNAIKFTPPGGTITVQMSEVKSLDVPNIFREHNRIYKVHSFVMVSISDTGVGIPVECHRRIFDKFQQVNNKGKGGMKGTGLGLSIAKHIVLDHGGDIWVESNMGNGSTFNFILPCSHGIECFQ